MTNNNFTALLRHESLPASLRTDLQTEVDCGLNKDSKLLLAAAIEGLLLGFHPELHRLTYTDPLACARLLAKEPLIGKRLWAAGEISAAVAAIDRKTCVHTLLDWWHRARLAYRRREAHEAAQKVHYADGRPYHPAPQRKAA